jgi:hypothetical protein
MAKKASNVSTSTNSSRKEFVEIGSMSFEYRKDDEGNILSDTPVFGAIETEFPETFTNIVFMNEERDQGLIMADREHQGLMLYIVRDDKKYLKGKIIDSQWRSQYTDFQSGEVSHNEFKFLQTRFWSRNPNKDPDHQALRAGDRLVFAIMK